MTLATFLFSCQTVLLVDLRLLRAFVHSNVLNMLSDLSELFFCCLQQQRGRYKWLLIAQENGVKNQEPHTEKWHANNPGGDVSNPEQIQDTKLGC